MGDSKSTLGFLVLLLIVLFSGTSSDAHSLSYNFTIDPRPRDDQPWCEVQGEVDQKIFLSYDCGTAKIKYLGPLGEEVKKTHRQGIADHGTSYSAAHGHSQQAHHLDPPQFHHNCLPVLSPFQEQETVLPGSAAGALSAFLLLFTLDPGGQTPRILSVFRLRCHSRCIISWALSHLTKSYSAL
ncbi:hypothetical protein AB1E18_007420 [Capra hircus]